MEGPETGAGDYIRGGGGAAVGAARVLRGLAVVVVVGLAVTAAVLAAAAAHHRSGAGALRSHGVPVVVTVTGCLDISSGIGMGSEYWRCSGSYRLAGSDHVEVINGSRRLLEKGQVVLAVAVPGRPSLLSVPSAVGPVPGWWSSYWPAVATGGAALVGAGVVVAGRRRPTVSATEP